METEQVQCLNHPSLVYRRVINNPDDKHVFFQSAYPIITHDEKGKVIHNTGWLFPCSCKRDDFVKVA